MTAEKKPLRLKLAHSAVILIIMICDQLSKWVITEQVLRPRTGQQGENLLDWLMSAPSRLDFISIEVLPFYNLVMVWNTGVSFGMLNSGPDSMPLILSGISLVIAFGFLLWMLHTRDRITGLLLALVIGGAFGNIIDRMRFGAVIDFMDFHVAGYHWPAFNLADSCIVVGVIGLLIHITFFEKKSSEERAD